LSSTAIRFTPGVRLHRDASGSAFLMIPEGVLELNDVARAILEHVDGVRGTEEIAEDLSRQFDAPIEEIRADVNALCTALRDAGYLFR
jgi:pyrroloquinoline quinone biosynthesis protein D